MAKNKSLFFEIKITGTALFVMDEDTEKSIKDDLETMIYGAFRASSHWIPEKEIKVEVIKNADS